MILNKPTLRLKSLGINTYNEPVIYMREDCHICKAEGFEAQARVKIVLDGRTLIATLNMVESDMLHHNEDHIASPFQISSFLMQDHSLIPRPSLLSHHQYMRSLNLSPLKSDSFILPLLF